MIQLSSGLRKLLRTIRDRRQLLSPEWRNLLHQINQHNILYGIPNVVVVGAAGGVGPRYYPLVRRQMIGAAGFEPEMEAYDKLVTQAPKISWYPFALGDKNTLKTLFITANPRCSSCLEPDMDILSDYPVAAWFIVRSQQEIQLNRFDTLYDERKVVFLPDFMHVDVQGFEFQVLQGMGKYIDNVVCIEIETQLKPIYRNQKLFADLKEFLEEKKFFLRSIEVQGYFEGEVLELNAYFVRRDHDLDDRTRSLVRIWEKICMLPTRPVLPSEYV